MDYGDDYGEEDIGGGVGAGGSPNMGGAGAGSGANPFSQLASNPNF
jgi:hypothetical protein